ncbi:MAG: acetyl-CoA carboxylase carboxyltransferase subunit beta [bacterium]
MHNQWTKCDKCRQIISAVDLEENLWVCPKCNNHQYITATQRIQITFNHYQELFKDIKPKDFLNFEDYAEKLKKDAEKLGIEEAIVVGQAYLLPDQQNEYPICFGIMDFGFRGGSMGSVVGEKIALIAQVAYEKQQPLIIFSASGGARMQEGIIALMQMAKTVASINKLKQKKIPFINVVTNPTTGGVAASFVGIADIIISEPEAIIGFAGQRVIEQTIKKKLPPNFQTAEFNLSNGLIDQIVHRKKIPYFLLEFIKAFYFWL